MKNTEIDILAVMIPLTYEIEQSLYKTLSNKNKVDFFLYLNEQIISDLGNLGIFK
jgi:hypothetical protein